MKNFTKFVQENNYLRAVKIICRYRANLAEKMHEECLLKTLSHDYHEKKLNEQEEFLISLTPPRKQWIQLGEGNRHRNSDKKYQKCTTFSINYKRVYETINRDFKTNCTSERHENLIKFLRKISNSCYDRYFTFSTPEIFPVRKGIGDEKEVECRPLSQFKNLCERILVSLANQYLSMLFGPFFFVESLAFRAPRKYHDKDKYITSHQDAVDRINDYRISHSEKHIYVAESDMKKFYDSVNHTIIKREFNKLLKKAVVQNDCNLNTKVIKRIFYAYLKCYSFPQDVFVNNNKKEYWDSCNIKNGKYLWIDKELCESGLCKNEKSLSHMRIGVPQGGALSGLISNIVLNYVDKQLSKIKGDYLYMRYCDDMILMSPDKKLCKDVLAEYNKSLHNVRLIPHEQSENLSDIFNKAEFWNCKSKPVYLWDYNNGSDWITFVGYEFRRSGEIRIRKKSLLKEERKQRRVAYDVMNKLEKKLDLNIESLSKSIKCKLISMSVGRVALWNYKTIENELCWINGFRKLNENPYASKQIKLLDRTRMNVNKWVKDCMINMSHKENFIKGRKYKSEKIFYGKPFSYYYHYCKNCVH